MQPQMMPSQMTQEQAVAQIKARKASLEGVLGFKESENAAYQEMITALEKQHEELSQVFPVAVVLAYKSITQCRLRASAYEINAIKVELAQANQLLAQAASPILVPGRAGVGGGGSIRQF